MAKEFSQAVLSTPLDYRGEGVAVAGFEIMFRGLSLCECFERKVGFYLPRHECGFMGNF